MGPTRTLLTVVALLIVTGCSAGTMDGETAFRTRTRTNLITFGEIRERGPFTSLYDLVEELRPRWLRSQGPDTFLGPQGRVQAHMDGNPVGSVEALRRLSAHGVTSVQWVSPIDAAARFGVGNSHGAIIISTAPIH
ncbi:MAG: hypothetical protein KY464_13995 [Gemmatimonadetes bacterium]|nr:hypothetical protein [Gemmatimonadota bacterium]